MIKCQKLPYFYYVATYFNYFIDINYNIIRTLTFFNFSLETFFLELNFLFFNFGTH